MAGLREIQHVSESGSTMGRTGVRLRRPFSFRQEALVAWLVPVMMNSRPEELETAWGELDQSDVVKVPQRPFCAEARAWPFRWPPAGIIGWEGPA